jgi:hypothetical protein
VPRDGAPKGRAIAVAPLAGRGGQDAAVNEPPRAIIGAIRRGAAGHHPGTRRTDRSDSIA